MTWRATFSAASVASVLFSILIVTAAAAQSGTVTYTYDALGRVVDAAYPDGTCLAYSYDAAGNRTQYTSSTVVGVVAPAVNITAYEALATTFDPRVGNPTCSALTVSAVGTPSHGTATIASGGVGIVYTPTAGYTGTDSFTYQVSSGGTSSPNGTVTVTIVAPTLGPTALAAKGGYYGPPPAQPIVTNVTPLVSSPYGYPVTVTGLSTPTHGTVSHSGNTITYIFTGGSQNKGYYDSYTYTVSDGFRTGTAIVSLTIFIASDQ